MFANILLLKGITEGDAAKFHTAIERGADVNYQGGTPLRVACKLGRHDMFDYLVKHADVAAHGDEALLAAIQVGSISMVSVLLSLKVNANGNDGMPLRLAASQGRADMVRALLAHGADATYRSSSALGIAVTLGHTKVAEVLIAAGADPYARDGEFVNAACGSPSMRALFDGVSRKGKAA